MPVSCPTRPVPRIRLRSVTVRRGPRTVVSGLDLDVTAGRVFWLVGPNGAGKSSLLRVMAGLDAPERGTVERTGDRAGFLYYHAEMTLPPWSVVRSWERLVRRLLPAPAPPTVLRPALGPGRRIRRLSTGERKRLLLDALLRAPGSLLLDEPFEHLSPEAKVALARMLEERAAGSVVVVATNQDTERAARDGGLRLEAGAAAATAWTPEERS